MLSIIELIEVLDFLAPLPLPLAERLWNDEITVAQVDDVYEIPDDPYALSEYEL